MALIEQVQRFVHKMGLIPKIVRSLRVLSTLLMLVGILWVFVLPMKGQFRSTYISENALMPSQAYSFFRESEWNFVRGYRDEVMRLIEEGVSLEEKNDAVESWLKDIGYKTTEYEYSEMYTNSTKTVRYGIYHVPRGDDTEAMVLTAPWITSTGEDNIGGIALLIGLARYFYRLSVWSKNIIIVIPENAEDALKNWVDAYHTSLDQTGGSIESAILLEFPSSGDYLDYLELGYAGINGRLPNLDLINCAVSIAEHEGFKISLHDTPKGQLWANDYYSRVTTILKSLFEMSTVGLVRFQRDGNGCEAFGGWNIQAISIKAKGTSGHDITTLGRVIEAVFRAVNNLLEKWHQSFFFYLLLAPRSFVSIGNYLPSAVFTCASLAVASLSSLLTNSNLNSVSTFEFKHCFISNISVIKGFLSFIIILTACLIFGFTSMSFVKSYSLDDNYDLYLRFSYGFISIPIILSTLPLLSTPLISANNGKRVTERDQHFSEIVRLLNSFSIFYLSMTLIGLLVVHYSLAFVISILAFPLTGIRYGSSGKMTYKNKLRNTLLLIISFPGTWIFVVGVLNKLEFNLDPVRNLIQYFRIELVEEIIDNIKNIDFVANKDYILSGPVELTYGLFSSYVRFGSCTGLIVLFGWLPVWLTSLIVTYVSVETSDDFEVDEVKKDN